MMTIYPIGKVDLPIKNPAHDPGRTRDENALKSIYGFDELNVRLNLVKVHFLGHEIPFNCQNGAAEALKEVDAAITSQLPTNPKLADFLHPWISGRETPSTFNWRYVRGTDRLSAHAFGIAIDLYDPSRPQPVYWLWEVVKKEAQLRGVSFQEAFETTTESQVQNSPPQRILQPPWELIDIFETHGFIWGGKWYHFDAIHFEYRPELL